MTGLRRHAEDYLVMRRSLGFKLDHYDWLLFDFVDHLESAGTTTITIDTAVAWATAPVGAHRSWWAARLSVVRGFARHLHAIDPACEVPPRGLLLAAQVRRTEPYLYSDDDIAALMRATGTIRTPLRAVTYRTLVGLLAVTGMRVGEAIGLDRADLDWDEGIVVVRGAKFNKSRQLPLHPTTVDALDAYAATRDRLAPRPSTPAFFVSLTGSRLIYNNVHLTFQRLVARAGLTPRSPRCRPRPHDLRHRFAVATLTGWYREDNADIDTRMHHLSTYLGHVDPSSTYWYLQNTPELMALVARRVEHAMGGPR